MAGQSDVTGGGARGACPGVRGGLPRGAGAGGQVPGRGRGTPAETQATPAAARPRPRETQTTPASPKLPISGAMEQARAAQVSHMRPRETQTTPAARYAPLEGQFRKARAPPVSHTPTTTHTGEAQVSHTRPRETQTTPAAGHTPLERHFRKARAAQVSTRAPAETQTTPAAGHAPLEGQFRKARAARVSRTHPWFSSAHAKPRASAGNTTRPPDPIGVGRSVAVALGFEPRVAVTPHSISSAAPSAARTRYLTRPLYYSHPLGTQIGHARWEQSHIRAPPPATVKHPRFPLTSDGRDTPCPPPPSIPAPPSGLPLDAGGRGAPQDGGPGQLAGPLTTKTPHTGARYRRIEDDTGQAHVASAQGHGLTGVTGPAGD